MVMFKPYTFYFHHILNNLNVKHLIKHSIQFPVWIILFTTSMLIGSIMWLYRFSKEDFFKGTRFINTKVVKNFADWYSF